MTLCTRCQREIIMQDAEKVVMVSLSVLDLRTGAVTVTNALTLCADCCEIPVLMLPELERDVRRALGQ